MAAEERSAGFVLFRLAGERLYLLLDYGKHWDYPKGHIEPDEEALAAAHRELTEETGIQSARVVGGFAREIGYFFRDKKKKLVRKSVIFYLAETDATEVKLSDEHAGFAFLPYHQARERLTFASARKVLDEAEKFLNGDG